MAGDDGGETEYASARKLVLRAANREAILISNNGGAGGGKSAGGSSGGGVLSSGIGGGGADAFGSGSDFSSMPLKPDHVARPCWVCPDGHIFLEAFHELYTSAYVQADALLAVCGRGDQH